MYPPYPARRNRDGGGLDRKEGGMGRDGGGWDREGEGWDVGERDRDGGGRERDGERRSGRPERDSAGREEKGRRRRKENSHSSGEEYSNRPRKYPLYYGDVADTKEEFYNRYREEHRTREEEPYRGEQRRFQDRRYKEYEEDPIYRKDRKTKTSYRKGSLRDNGEDLEHWRQVRPRDFKDGIRDGDSQSSEKPSYLGTTKQSITIFVIKIYNKTNKYTAL